MKKNRVFYWIALLVILLMTAPANAQQVGPSVTGKQAKKEMKAEKKREKERRKREKAELKKDQQELKESGKPKYKKGFKRRKKIAPKPGKEVEQKPKP